MKKGSKFLTGLVTAGITFGALMLTLGPDKFNTYGKHRAACYNAHSEYCHHHNHHTQ